MTERRDSQESPPSSQEPGSPTLHFTIGLLLDALPQEKLLAALRVMLSLESEEERTVALLQRLVRETGCPIGDLRRRGYPEAVTSALERLFQREGEGHRQLVERAIATELSRSVLSADIEEREGRRRIHLSAERLCLREMKSEDWRDIHRYTSDPAVVQFLDWGPNTEQQTRADVGASIARRNSVPRLDLFLVATLRESDQVIGGCGLGIAKENPTAASLGFLFNRECWGKGYATECATAMLRFGFERLRLHRVSASCDVLNVSSCRVLEKLGMVREGHLRDGRYHQGRWRDSFVYGILAEEFLVRNLSSSPPVIT